MKILQIKFVVLQDDRILCHGGFKNISNLKYSEIRFFANSSNAIVAIKAAYPNCNLDRLNIRKVALNVTFLKED